MQSIEQITPEISALFQPLDYHLAVASILAGLTPGAVWVDDPVSPSLGLAWFHSRVYLAGKAASAAGWQGLADTLTRDLVPQIVASRGDGFGLHAEPLETLQRAGEMLPALRPILGMRQHYVCDRLAQNWRTVLPTGYTLQPVDATLLNDPAIINIAWLCEEMISERPSIEDFLEKSFGVCVVQNHEILGWCLSEYNCARRCEVGVATADGRQRRGLGKAMTLALVEAAFQRGLQQVGWQCSAKNVPSAMLALSAGFRLEHEFSVLYCSLGEAT